MELTYQLFIAALAAVLASAFNLVLAPFWTRLRGRSADGRGNVFAVQVAGLVVQICAGALLGFIYWLSWGLAAVVGVPWWLRGAMFALAFWSAGPLPALIAQAVVSRIQWRAAIVAVLEWLTTLIFVGLACGWVWSRGP